jgi:hypothetical protein
LAQQSGAHVAAQCHVCAALESAGKCTLRVITFKSPGSSSASQSGAFWQLFTNRGVVLVPLVSAPRLESPRLRKIPSFGEMIGKCPRLTPFEGGAAIIPNVHAFEGSCPSDTPKRGVSEAHFYDRSRTGSSFPQAMRCSSFSARMKYHSHVNLT